MTTFKMDDRFEATLGHQTQAVINQISTVSFLALKLLLLIHEQKIR